MRDRATMVKLLRLALLLVGAVILQAMIVSRVTILGVYADVYLILVVLVAMGNGPVTGVVFGFAAGLMADVIFLEPIGLRAVIYLAVGYVVGRYAQELHLSGAWVVMLITALVSLLAGLGYAMMQFVIGPQQDVFTMLRAQVLPSILVNALLAAPLYLGLIRLRILTLAAPPRASLR